MPMQFRPGEPPVDPVIHPASLGHARSGHAPPGPYQAGYDVRLGYEGAAVEAGPAEEVVFFGARGAARR